MITEKIKNFTTKAELWTLIKLTPFIFALHEFEEWNVLAWHRRYQSNIPDVIDLHLRIVFIVLVAAAFLFFFLVLRMKNRNTAIKALFPFFSLMIYNGLVHLYWSIYFTSYSPGLIFGFIASFPLAGLIIYKMISGKLVSKWFASIIGITFMVLFVHVVTLGDKLEPGIVNAMLIGKAIARWIGL